MDDVLVEQCGYHGVVAIGTGIVGRCTKVEVRQCVNSGVVAESGASITLIGAKTKVHHNCALGSSGDYGLKVLDASSTIQMVSPLLSVQVSHDNGGGGNCGAGNGADTDQIKTITKADFTAVLEQEAAMTATTAIPSADSVRVPEDCKTLKEAVERVHGDDGLSLVERAAAQAKRMGEMTAEFLGCELAEGIGPNKKRRFEAIVAAAAAVWSTYEADPSKADALMAKSAELAKLGAPPEEVVDAMEEFLYPGESLEFVDVADDD